MTSKTLAMAASLAFLATAVAADEYTPALEAYLESDVRVWAGNPVLVEAIRTQNSVTGSYDQPQIDAMDKKWRSEVGGADAPTIAPVLNNAAADVLRGIVEASGGRVTEIFIMDARGLNVAVSQVTSDFWQGDEDKFAKTYAAGPGAFFIDEVELDESSQTYQGQISVAIVDPATGELLGAMTVGVDAETLG